MIPPAADASVVPGLRLSGAVMDLLEQLQKRPVPDETAHAQPGLPQRASIYHSAFLMNSFLP